MLGTTGINKIALPVAKEDNYVESATYYGEGYCSGPATESGYLGGYWGESAADKERQKKMPPKQKRDLEKAISSLGNCERHCNATPGCKFFSFREGLACTMYSKNTCK